MRSLILLALIGPFTTPLLPLAVASVTPAQVCQASKGKEAGKYALCRQRAEAKYAVSGNQEDLTKDLDMCARKLAVKWPTLELRAGGACITSGDQAGIQNAVDKATANIATFLAGGVLSECDADLQTCDVDRQACDADLQACRFESFINLRCCFNNQTLNSVCQGDLARCQQAPHAATLQTGQTQCWDASGALMPCTGTGQDGELKQGVARAYEDNGDGTITDPNTGLMWETLSDDGSIHDKDNVYTWANAFSKIASLNTGGFGGYYDWRLPNRSELDSLVALNATGTSVPSAFNTGCTAGCTIFSCSCTQAEAYWTSSTYQNNPQLAWFVYFVGGSVNAAYKTENIYVRAVRLGYHGY